MTQTTGRHGATAGRPGGQADPAVAVEAAGTISTTITTTVTIGPGAYPNVLTITGSGEVAPSGAGATGVYVEPGLAGVRIVNHGVIVGGVGRHGSSTGVGGIAVEFASRGTLANDGTITGGAGAPHGSAAGGAVEFAGGGMLTNHGAIIGGTGGPGAYYIGGMGPGGTGGFGVDLGVGGTLANFGTIAGGTGGSSFYFGGNGGNAVDLASRASLINQATIAGGTAQGLYGIGGVGVELASRATLTNHGQITGGIGGDYSFLETGYGGDGVDLALRTTLTNTGTITGGLGAQGGNGVYLAARAVLTNRGSIAGGAGEDGRGGIGVDIAASGVVTTGGTISGGVGSDGTTADAVLFGSAAGTLVVDPGAVFDGLVVANVAVDDMLVLAGTAAGTLDGLGSQLIGFRTVSVAAHANWTLTDASDLGTHAALSDDGTLDVASGQFDGGAASIARSALLQASGTGVVHVGRLTLAGGTLAGGGAAGVVVGGVHATERVGRIVVQGGAAVAGFGTVAGATVLDAGTIEAIGGKLALATSVSGPGTIAISAQSVLLAQAGVATTMTFLAGGGETLALAAPMQVTGTIAGFAAGDTIDLLDMRATGFSFSTTTDILTVTGRSGTIAALHFSGGDTTASFARSVDHDGGTLITHT